MIQGIRNIELAIGNGVKMPTKSELKNIQISRKSIVASRIIKTGEVFSQDNMTVKRPGDGMSPMMWDKILDQTADRDYMEDEKIQALGDLWIKI